MKKYLYIVKMAIMDVATYPFGFFGNLFKDGVTLIIYLFLWKSLYAGKEEVLGYSLSGIVTYYAISFAIRALVNTRSVTRDVEQGVRTGKMASLLIKPINYNLYVFLNKDIHNFIKIIAPACVVVFLTYYLKVFQPSQHIFMFFISFGMSIAISTLFHSILGTMAFWLVNTWGVRVTVGRAISLLNGSIIPLAFFPTWLVTINDFLPFKHMVSTPVVIYLNQLDVYSIYQNLVIQFIWIIVIFILHKLIWDIAIKRFDSVGN